MMPRMFRGTQRSYADPVRKLVSEIVIERDLKLADLSRRVGKNDSYLFQFLNRHKPRELPEFVRLKLASILGVDETTLRGTQLAQIAPQKAPARHPPQATQVRDLPIMGRALAGSDTLIFPDNGTPQGYTERPRFLDGIDDAFCAYVCGNSMEPRYFAGEKVYVNPTRPISSGCFVLADFLDDTAVIKRYVDLTDLELVLFQFNPEQELRYPRRLLRHIWRIVGNSE